MRIALRGVLLGMVLTAPWTGARSLWSQETDGNRRVGTIKFTGNSHIKDRELGAAIATQEASFLARVPILRSLGLGTAPPFNYTEFRRDVLRVKALYGARGFPDAVVDTVLFRTGRRVSIDFRITENEPVRITTLDVRGVPPRVPDDEVRAAIPLREGGPFDRLEFTNARVLLRSRLRDAGYPWVNVEGTFDLDSVGKTASVTFSVDPGPRAVIDDIEIVGRLNTDERVILENMSIDRGDAFSEEAMYQDQLALFRTGLFTDVTVSLADTNRPPDDSLVTVIVRAQVVEGQLRNARVGAGYGSRDCFRTLANFEWLDFAGGGRRLQLDGRLSQIGTGAPIGGGLERSLCRAMIDEEPERLKLNYYIGATVNDPLLSHPRWSGRISAFAERHTEIKAFLRETVRGEVALTRDVFLGIPVTASYSLSYGRTLADATTFCLQLDICRLADTRAFEKVHPRSVLSVEARRHTTSSLLDPRQGSAWLVNVSWASQLIGSDPLARWLRADGEYSAYYPVGGGNVLAWRLLGGFVTAPARDTPTGPERFVPPENRFYAGGPNSVRGFGQNELGPVVRVLERVDSSGATPDSTIRTSAVGADRLALANLEFRFPLPLMDGKLYGAVFTDAAWLGTSGGFSFSRVRATPGIGVRLQTAIGPVGVDFAYNPYRTEAGPLYRVEGSDLVLVRDDYRPRRGRLDWLRVSFSVGQAF
jgi:outer membrane protein insertion porin family/translocation and assembly module TamA